MRDLKESIEQLEFFKMVTEGPASLQSAVQAFEDCIKASFPVNEVPELIEDKLGNLQAKASVFVSYMDVLIERAILELNMAYKDEESDE